LKVIDSRNIEDVQFIEGNFLDESISPCANYIVATNNKRILAIAHDVLRLIINNFEGEDAQRVLTELKSDPDYISFFGPSYNKIIKTLEDNSAGPA